MGIEDRAGSSQEQKRIATTLALMDGYSFEDLKEIPTNFTDGKTQDYYLRRAIAVFKDLEELGYRKPGEVLTPEERLMKVLVDGGIVLEDAAPTYSELLLAVEDVIKNQAQLDQYVKLIACPFCKEDGFDLVGLKSHMARYCEVYQKTEDLP